MTDHHDIHRYLQMLAGTAGPDELLELRYRLDDGVGMGQVFISTDRLDGLATRAIALSRRVDVYIGCAPRTRRHGGRRAVEHAHVLWADCDGDDAVDALADFMPAPPVVIASGSGRNCHAYWPLRRPAGRDDVERANRRIAHALTADPVSSEAARILRPPQTRSHKRTPATAVRALRMDTTTRFDLDDVVGSLSDPKAEQAKRFTRTREASRTGDPLLSITPPEYVQRLLGVEVPRHGKVRCPFHDELQPSLHVYDTPERGWYCYGSCRRGGSIYDLAAPLYGYSTRGPEFLKLKAELCRLFGVEAPRGRRRLWRG